MPRIILEISPSVQRVGYGREQLIGTNVLDVYENPEQRMELVKAILERGEVSDYEIRLQARRRSRYRHVHQRA